MIRVHGEAGYAKSVNAATTDALKICSVPAEYRDGGLPDFAERLSGNESEHFVMLSRFSGPEPCS